MPEAQLDLPVTPEDEIENQEVIQEMINDVENKINEDLQAEEQHDKNEATKTSSNDGGMTTTLILTAVASFALGFIISRKNWKIY